MKDWLFWLCYFSPSLIAWYRARKGHTITLTLGQIFAINFFLGLTIVGWFVAMASAFGKNPIAWLAYKIVKSGAVPMGTPSAPYDPAGQSQGMTCGQCQGSGSMSCSSCSGRGSWYDPPQGANGVAQLRNCPACTSSGRLRCSYCGGSGRLP